MNLQEIQKTKIQDWTSEEKAKLVEVLKSLWTDVKNDIVAFWAIGSRVGGWQADVSDIDILVTFESQKVLEKGRVKKRDVRIGKYRGIRVHSKQIEVNFDNIYRSLVLPVYNLENGSLIPGNPEDEAIQAARAAEKQDPEKIEETKLYDDGKPGEFVKEGEKLFANSTGKIERLSQKGLITNQELEQLKDRIFDPLLKIKCGWWREGSRELNNLNFQNRNQDIADFIDQLKARINNFLQNN